MPTAVTLNKGRGSFARCTNVEYFRINRFVGKDAISRNSSNNIVHNVVWSADRFLNGSALNRRADYSFAKLNVSHKKGQYALHGLNE